MYRLNLSARAEKAVPLFQVALKDAAAVPLVFGFTRQHDSPNGPTETSHSKELAKAAMGPTPQVIDSVVVVRGGKIGGRSSSGRLRYVLTNNPPRAIPVYAGTGNSPLDVFCRALQAEG